MEEGESVVVVVVCVRAFRSPRRHGRFVGERRNWPQTASAFLFLATTDTFATSATVSPSLCPLAVARDPLLPSSGGESLACQAFGPRDTGSVPRELGDRCQLVRKEKEEEEEGEKKVCLASERNLPPPPRLVVTTRKRRKGLFGMMLFRFAAVVRARCEARPKTAFVGTVSLTSPFFRFALSLSLFLPLSPREARVRPPRRPSLSLPLDRWLAG